MSTVTYIDSLPQDFSLLWYQLEGVLRRGGFGITYLAKDKKPGSPGCHQGIFSQ